MSPSSGTYPHLVGGGGGVGAGRHTGRVPAVRRPLHVAAVAGVAVHNAFELGAGAGLIFQPELGLAGAAALWGTWLPAWAALAAYGGRRFDGPLAFLAGGGLGMALLHFVVWPTGRRYGLPVLTAAEGMTARLLPAYNAVLYAWAAASVAALARETPRGRRAPVVPGIAAALAMRPNVDRHLRWLRADAARRLRWWNRAGA